jgi:hypothetical protein
VAVTSPSVLAKGNPKLDIVQPEKERLIPSAEQTDQNLQYDRLRFYTEEHWDRIQLGDTVESDLGDRAVVVQKSFFPPDPKYMAIDCMPIKMRTYHYHDINDFKIIPIQNEKSIQKEKS